MHKTHRFVNRARKILEAKEWRDLRGLKKILAVWKNGIKAEKVGFGMQIGREDDWKFLRSSRRERIHINNVSLKGAGAFPVMLGLLCFFLKHLQLKCVTWNCIW